jgi:DNA helicase HerA-like ATPase
MTHGSYRRNGVRELDVAVDLLGDIRFYQLHSAPRRGPDSERPDPIPAQLFAALTATHAKLAAEPDGRGRLVVAWERRVGDPRLRVLLGGYPDFPPVRGATGDVRGADASRRSARAHELLPVLYPPGSRAHAVDPCEVLASWQSQPAWIRCDGRPDALWNAGGRIPGGQIRGGFDDYVAHLGDAFVWLTIASPLPIERIDEELASLDVQIPRLRRQESLESSRIALRRAESRFLELSRARETGMWNVHILVGGGSPASARGVAAMLCGATDLDDLPYTLAPAGHCAPLTEAMTGCSPFQATTELLVALARPPKRELPGVHVVDRAEFDLTPEIRGPIALGGILDDAGQLAGPFTVSTDTLNRHTFVAGATGAGKSQTVRHVLEQLHKAAVPWLVIEPAKAEYARMAGRIGGDRVTVIRPGAPDAPPVGLNPLEPEPGFPMQTHIDLVRALFLAAFEAEEPFPQVLHQALIQCYTDLGWDPVLGESRIEGVTPKHPQLGDLQRTALDVVTGIGYGREITDNVRGFIDVRISSLRLGTPGRFFEGGHPLDVADLLRRNVVLEIEDLGNDQDKAFLMGAVLIRLYEHLRTRHAAQPGGPGEPGSQFGLRHVTVIEEAHRLLKHVELGSPAAHAVELFTALLAEIRAYGEGIMIAEQIPTKVVSDIVKNTALKIIHRLPAADDREVLGAAMNLDEAQSRHVVSMPPGRAVVFADGMDRPMRIVVPLGEAREGTAAGPPAAIVRTRAVTCGSLCRTRACVLREINYAIRLGENPRLILWIELLTAAHVVGRPAPRPDRAWLRQFGEGVERRILECAIGHRVQAAVDSRYHGLLHYYQPESLAEHLRSVAMAYVDNGASPCDGSEVHWQAGQYRWLDVLSALKASPELNHPHPDTTAWAQRGLRLTGNTTAEQLDALRRHPDSWLPDSTIATGTGTPPIVLQAAAQLSQDPDPRSRLLEAILFLNLRTTWPLSVFAAAHAAADTANTADTADTADTEEGTRYERRHAFVARQA